MKNPKGSPKTTQSFFSISVSTLPKTQNILGFSFPNYMKNAENYKFKIYKFLETYMNMEKKYKIWRH